MRRAPGFVIVVAAAGAAALAVPGLGCSHDAKPAVEPDPNPPLPPASGTPIGYLVDDAGELKLTDAQLGKLKAIDDDLAAKLAALDGQLRGPSQSQSGQPTGRRRGGGMRGGGMRGGGMRGGGMRGGGAGNAAGSGSGSAAGSGGGRRGASADAIGRVTEERAADVRDAIDRALGELDVIQRIAAKRVLADHGVDVDAGRGGAAGGSAKSGKPAAGPAGERGEPDEPDEPDGDGSGSN